MSKKYARKNIGNKLVLADNYQRCKKLSNVKKQPLHNAALPNTYKAPTQNKAE